MNTIIFLLLLTTLATKTLNSPQILHVIHVELLLLLSKRYNSCRVLAFSTIFFHSWRSWTCSVHLRSFIFLRSFLTSSSHLCLGLPTGRVIYGCHLYIFFTMMVSGFLYVSVPAQSLGFNVVYYVLMY